MHVPHDALQLIDRHGIRCDLVPHPLPRLHPQRGGGQLLQLLVPAIHRCGNVAPVHLVRVLHIAVLCFQRGQLGVGELQARGGEGGAELGEGDLARAQAVKVGEEVAHLHAAGGGHDLTGRDAREHSWQVFQHYPRHKHTHPQTHTHSAHICTPYLELFNDSRGIRGAGGQVGHAAARGSSKQGPACAQE